MLQIGFVVAFLFGQEVVSELDINKSLLNSIAKGAFLYENSLQDFLAFDGSLKETLSEATTINKGGRLNKAVRQFATKMIADIDLLKKQMMHAKPFLEIEKIRNAVVGNGLIERLASVRNLDEAKKEVLEFEDLLPKIRKIFGNGSFVELMAFLKVKEVRKNQYLVGMDFYCPTEELNQGFDYFFKNGWESNSIIETKRLRLICMPSLSKDWEKEYISNVKNLEEITKLAFDEYSQENLEFYYYRIMYHFNRKEYLDGAKVFEKIPPAWLVGSSDHNLLFIVNTFVVASECYLNISGKTKETLDSLECAVHFVRSRYTTESNLGKRLFYAVGNNLHAKYIQLNSSKKIRNLEALFEEEGLNPPWKQGLKLQQK